MKKIDIFTDGACSGNPGPGGYGTILRFNMAVIKGLQALKEPCEVTLYSDSQYVINAITKGWAVGWKKRGWVKADKKPALNSDLWEIILQLLEVHKVSFVWVKGHAGHPENERCDHLAVTGSQEAKKLGECFDKVVAD